MNGALSDLPAVVPRPRRPKGGQPAVCGCRSTPSPAVARAGLAKTARFHSLPFTMLANRRPQRPPIRKPKKARLLVREPGRTDADAPGETRPDGVLRSPSHLPLASYINNEGVDVHWSAGEAAHRAESIIQWSLRATTRTDAGTIIIFPVPHLSDRVILVTRRFHSVSNTKMARQDRIRLGRQSFLYYYY